MPPSHERPRDDAGRFSLDEGQRPQGVALVSRERMTEQPAGEAHQVHKNFGPVVKAFVTIADDSLTRRASTSESIHVPVGTSLRGRPRRRRALAGWGGTSLVYPRNCSCL